MDIAGERQPFVRPLNKVALVCTGEIYNHTAVRAVARDVAEFASKSDVEVIAYLYEQHGTDMVDLLDGMFAFAMYDSRRDDFFVARDRFGIKPLYYLTDGKQWLFASEVKAFIRTGYDLRAVREVPPGSMVTRAGVHPWLPQSVPRPTSIGDPAILRAVLASSVEKHLQADPDVRIGVFLSGGLDSSIITALAVRQRPDIVAFTIGMDDSPDVSAARRVAEHLGIRLVECPLDLQDAYRRLPEAVRLTESYNAVKVLEGLLTMMLAEAAASEGVKVILLGEGADEVFAGYGFMRKLGSSAMKEACQTLLRNIGSAECMRLDRATMAFSVEARVPFLDPFLVDWAMSLPSTSLVRQRQGRLIEKWMMREAFSDLLPQDIIWRMKLAYNTGSGIMRLLNRMVEQISDLDVKFARRVFPTAGILDKLGVYLHRIWRKVFGECGGEEMHAMFGAYPLMPCSFDVYQSGGTGEDDAEVAVLKRARKLGYRSATC